VYSLFLLLQFSLICAFSPALNINTYMSKLILHRMHIISRCEFFLTLSTCPSSFFLFLVSVLLVGLYSLYNLNGDLYAAGASCGICCPPWTRRRKNCRRCVNSVDVSRQHLVHIHLQLGSCSCRTGVGGVEKRKTGTDTPETCVQRHASDSTLEREMNREREGTDNAAMTVSAAFVVLPTGCEWGRA
jgi:hypothetical protein